MQLLFTLWSQGLNSTPSLRGEIDVSDMLSMRLISTTLEPLIELYTSYVSTQLAKPLRELYLMDKSEQDSKVKQSKKQNDEDIA